MEQIVGTEQRMIISHKSVAEAVITLPLTAKLVVPAAAAPAAPIASAMPTEVLAIKTWIRQTTGE